MHFEVLRLDPISGLSKPHYYWTYHSAIALTCGQKSSSIVRRIEPSYAACSGGHFVVLHDASCALVFE